MKVNQRGSALIVSLVFLIILTLLGLSTMNTSRLEIRMAINEQAANQAFQAAESGIQETLADGSVLDTNSQAGVDNTYYYNQDANGPYTDGTNNYNEQVNTNTLFETSGPVPGGGFSLGGKVQAYHFRVLSVGQSVSGSENEQTQGFYQVGPGA